MAKKRDLSKYFLPDMNKARKRINESKVINEAFRVPENIKDYGKGKTFHIRTYGCQSNVRDTEIMSGMLQIIGYTLTEDPFKADLIILNTCAIRENAEKKVFGEIGWLKQIKKTKNPNLIFGITGCMTQEETIVKKMIEDHEHIDFIIGTHNIHRLLDILEQVVLDKTSVVEVWSKEGDVIESLPDYRSSSIKAFVNVMYGCDNFCTYCIVPYTRGKIRSRQKEHIIEEINDLIKKGYKEVTLLGQNVNSYGIDFKDQNYKFPDLLEDVAKTGIKRVRFATSNPWNFDDKIVEVINKYDNIMPYIHLPVQSGDETILKAMNREMKIQDYIDKIKLIRSTIKNCAISTDLIVGFPNETNEQFENTLKLYNEVKYDNAYTFIYSPRDGTYAATLKDNTTLEEKKKRLEKLNNLVRKYAKENNEKFVGQTVEVLVEGPSKKNESILSGYSPEWKVVNFQDDGSSKIGDIVKVKITKASRFSLDGEKVK